MKRNPVLYQWLILAFVLVSFSSCDPLGIFGGPEPEPEPTPPAKVEGWAPIYNTDQLATVISAEQPRLIDKGGKIYVKGDTLFQIETGKGIHVMYIKQPDNPQKIKFISVLGAQEMAIKDNTLYTNNVNDLVVIDISNINNIQLIDRISNVFHIVDQNFPPGSGYYECPVSSKGTVVGWEQKTLNYPQCRN